MAEKAWYAWNMRFGLNPARFRRLAYRAYFLLPVAALALLLIFAVSGPSSSHVDAGDRSSRASWRVSEPSPPEAAEPVKTTLRINLVDFPFQVRKLLFGFLYGRFPLTPQEALKEQGWRARIMAFVRTATYCNQFFGDPDRGAVVQLSDFRVKSDRRDQEATEDLVQQLLRRDGYHVSVGGTYNPTDCTARETVAVVVPYRDRFENLVTFLNYMHRYLQRQRRRYVLVVAEQANTNASFNRAKLFNAVLRELLHHDGPQIDCFVLHDVDKVPYHLFNLYACGFQPRQIATMAWNSTSEKWVDYYSTFFGGVTAFSRWQLLKMNGVSNSFYGWGAEDDDMYGRSILAGFLPSYPSKYVGRMWVMGHHDDMKVITKRYEMLWTDRIAERMAYDGLWEAQYVVQAKSNRPLYTKFSFIV